VPKPLTGGKEDVQRASESQHNRVSQPAIMDGGLAVLRLLVLNRTYAVAAVISRNDRHCDCKERSRKQSRSAQDIDRHGLLRRLRRLAMTPSLYVL
jgi:hypothetical protein